MSFFSSDMYAWFVLPILIFAARIIDVSLGTIRIIFVSKGLKNIAPIFGFFEMLIWLFAVMEIIRHLTNISYYIVFAAGFAMGTLSESSSKTSYR